LLVLAAFGGVVWLAYQRGVAQGHSDVPRVITAEAGPAKVPPANAGGAPTPYTGLKIYQQPAPSNEDAETDTAPAPTPAAASPPPETIPTRTETVAAVPAPTPAPAAAKPAAAPTETAPMRTAAATTGPITAPSVTLAPVRTVEPATVKPAALAPAIIPPAASPPVTTAPASGAGLLQIGAYKSEAEANTAWNAYKSKHASLLAAMSPDVKQVDLGAKGTWYRLRISAGSTSSAAALCDKLKAEGGACFPAK
jgi:hypothetical protein